MNVDQEYGVRWIRMRRSNLKLRKLALIHLACKVVGVGVSTVTARRCYRCANCHFKVSQDIVDRAIFLAGVQGQVLHGFEMRQANLVRWSRADYQRKLSGLK